MSCLLSELEIELVGVTRFDKRNVKCFVSDLELSTVYHGGAFS